MPTDKLFLARRRERPRSVSAVPRSLASRSGKSTIYTCDTHQRVTRVTTPEGRRRTTFTYSDYDTDNSLTSITRVTDNTTGAGLTTLFDYGTQDLVLRLRAAVTRPRPSPRPRWEDMRKAAPTTKMNDVTGRTALTSSLRSGR